MCVQRTQGQILRLAQVLYQLTHLLSLSFSQNGFSVGTVLRANFGKHVGKHTCTPILHPKHSYPLWHISKLMPPCTYDFVDCFLLIYRDRAQQQNLEAVDHVTHFSP